MDGRTVPRGRFGDFGGRFVPETLVPACAELEAAFREAWADPAFRTELDDLLRDYAGRPSPLDRVPPPRPRSSACRVLLKREDLNHTGSHKINNVLGQALLAKRMGKTRLVAETGAGQHGVATATAAALLGLECVVYMGEVDMDRQALNVFRMRLLGAEVRPAVSGSRTLKDAVNEAMRDWVATVERLPLLPRLGDGPASVPVDGARVPPRHRRRGPGAVRGAPRRRQCPTSSSPASAAAPTPSASSPASPTPTPSSSASSPPAAPPSAGASPASSTACSRYLMQDECGQVSEAAVDLRRPRLPRRRAPSTRHLDAIGRARYEPVTDAEVIDAFQLLSRTEGIIPALEPAHALAWVSAATAARWPARPCCSTCRAAATRTSPR